MIELGEKLDQYILKSDLNTDNAWVESTVVIYNNSTGNLFNEIPINVSAVCFILIV